MRKRRPDRTTPVRSNESLIARRPAPAGMVTRTGAPPLPLQLAAVTRSAAAARARDARMAARTLTSARTLQRILKDDRGGERVDIRFAVLVRATHLTDGAQCGGRRVSFVD